MHSFPAEYHDSLSIKVTLHVVTITRESFKARLTATADSIASSVNRTHLFQLPIVIGRSLVTRLQRRIYMQLYSSKESRHKMRQTNNKLVIN